MERYELNESLKTGVKIIDTYHKERINAINDLADAIFLDTVKKYQIKYRENPEKQSAIALKIHQELAHWLVRHIKGIEVKRGAETIAAGA
ncbi:hypothetical protein A5482_003080 [Cyanobacterium sp. IPPAS B-1200]|uniref:hypothetical protein n=1 Tax=Cyanobacterium sp. IPPAS B-1200 TaxID=1562720 RepID=UPI0008526098|nr:hypothetical protein [Cyanobacterium sp. IPPAS B-1200]OEJ77995.1 hypothetical protein A5482_04040 [Cyanobacterium sp. IPPAS B-1200]